MCLFFMIELFYFIGRYDHFVYRVFVIMSYLSKYFCIERDVAQWLERGALPMSLPVVRF